MICFQNKENFFIRSQNFIEQGIQTLVIRREDTQIKIVKDDQLLNS